MSNEPIKQQVSQFKAAISDFTACMQPAMIAVQDIVNKHGLTKETFELVKSFYEIKIYNCELFERMYHDIVTNDDFNNVSSDGATFVLASLKQLMDKTMEDTKNDLKEVVENLKQLP